MPSGLGPCLALAFGLLLTTTSNLPAPAQQTGKKMLRVSAASELAPAMPALAQNYERASGVILVIVTGPSGEQVRRIEAGEVVDLFLGADFISPEKLVSDALTDAKAPVAYAKNSLVLFARKDSPLQPLSLESLQDQRLQQLAMPDQLQDPTGRAALAALTRLKVELRLSSKIIQTKDVIAAGDLALTGKAQLALLPLTLAKSQPYQQAGSFIFVPESQYPEMRQYAVVMRKGNADAARHFLDWLMSSDIQSKLPNIGLEAIR